jgi:hypothetical protein
MHSHICVAIAFGLFTVLACRRCKQAWQIALWDYRQYLLLHC